MTQRTLERSLSGLFGEAWHCTAAAHETPTLDQAVIDHETHVSAQQPASEAHARVPRTHEHQGRSASHRQPSCPRPGEADPLTGPRHGPQSGDSEPTSEHAYRPFQRLTAKAQFERVFRNSLRSGDRLFTVLAIRGQAEHPRLGLAISRKAAGNAVARNRIKRLVRESFRQHAARLPPVDVVVMARPGITGHTNRDISDSLVGHWQRIAKQCGTSSSP